MSYDLTKLVRVSALQQLAQRTVDNFYTKEETNEKIETRAPLESPEFLEDITVVDSNGNSVSCEVKSSNDIDLLELSGKNSNPIIRNIHDPIDSGDAVNKNYVDNKEISEFTGILPISKGGTGNNHGYIITGAKDNSDIGIGATVEGFYNESSGKYSHSEGQSNMASGDQSHAEGFDCHSQGENSHSEGEHTKARGSGSHTEGFRTLANGKYSHVEGNMSATKTVAFASHAEGRSVAAGKYAHAEGAGYDNVTITLGEYLNSNKYSYFVSDNNHPKEGMYYFEDLVNDFDSSSNTWLVTAVDTTNSIVTFNKNDSSLANTEITLYGYNGAIGDCSHAEGYVTSANGRYSHAEGYETKTTGQASHAEGYKTIAKSLASHASGYGTISQRNAQHVFGAWNIPDGQGAVGTQGKYVEIVGNGSNEENRSNARTLDWSGNEVLAGKLTIGANPTADMDVTPKSYVDALKPLIVTVENDIASKTAAEIYAEIPKRQIMCLYNNIYYSITYCSSTLAEFGYYANTSDYAKVSIDASGNTIFSGS